MAPALAVAQQDAEADPGQGPRQEKNVAEDLGAFGEFLFGKPKQQGSGSMPATPGSQAVGMPTTAPRRRWRRREWE